MTERKGCGKATSLYDDQNAYLNKDFTAKMTNKPIKSESEQILDRVAQESESIGKSSFARTANQITDHFSAAEADENDWAELWGRRIGRGLSVIAFIVLAIWLFGYLTR